MNYLLSITLLLFAVWPAYYFLLRHSERYTLNRVLLVLVMIVIGFLPFLDFSSPTPLVTQSLQGTIEYVEESVRIQAPPPEAKSDVFVIDAAGERQPILLVPITPLNTLPVAYLFGLGFMALLLGFRLLLLLFMHLRSRPNGDARYRLLYPTARAGQAFTFGRNLYFSGDVPDAPDFDHILAHERVHARQLHSLDILLSELFLCVFWFHPVAWWLRTKMRANLEYLVDQAVLQSGSDRRSYQLALVRQSQLAQGLALALPFSEPSLKSRISRMTGLPQHRLVGIIATAAVLFWLGIACIMLKGTTQNHQPEAIVFGQAVKQNNFLPDHSFEIYFRRVPTVNEYYQIKALVDRIPNTQLYLFKNPESEFYSMQLEHWLNQPAVIRNIPKEPLPDWSFRLSLFRPLSFVQDDNPHPSAGYYTPFSQTLKKEINPTTGKTGTMTIHGDNWNATMGRIADFDFAAEDIVVLIDGERFTLHPPERVKTTNGEDFVRFADGRVAPEFWEDALLEDPLYLPPVERINRYFRENYPAQAIQRHIQYHARGAQLEWFNSLPLPTNRTIRYYHNNKPVERDFLLTSDFGANNVIQVGYVSNALTGDIVVQVVDDMVL